MQINLVVSTVQQYVNVDLEYMRSTRTVHYVLYSTERRYFCAFSMVLQTCRVVELVEYCGIVCVR